MIRIILTVAIYVLIECVYLFGAQYVVGDLATTDHKAVVAALNVLWFAVTTFIIEIHDKIQGLRSDWIDMILNDRRNG